MTSKETESKGALGTGFPERVAYASIGTILTPFVKKDSKEYCVHSELASDALRELSENIERLYEDKTRSVKAINFILSENCEIAGSVVVVHYSVPVLDAETRSMKGREGVTEPLYLEGFHVSEKLKGGCCGASAEVCGPNSSFRYSEDGTMYPGETVVGVEIRPTLYHVSYVNGTFKKSNRRCMLFEDDGIYNITGYEVVVPNK